MCLMNVLKNVLYSKKKVAYFLLFELLIIIVYGLIAAKTFSAQEVVFQESEMQLKNRDDIVEGNYLDSTYVDTEAVVTPAFRLQKGIII